jgi:hypothetical protein
MVVVDWDDEIDDAVVAVNTDAGLDWFDGFPPRPVWICSSPIQKMLNFHNQLTGGWLDWSFMAGGQVRHHLCHDRQIMICCCCCWWWWLGKKWQQNTRKTVPEDIQPAELFDLSCAVKDFK